MRNVAIFIDESGTLPDPNDKVVIVAAVGTQIPEKLLKIGQSVRKFQKKQDGTEIKFYKAGDRTKKKFWHKKMSEPAHAPIQTIKKSVIQNHNFVKRKI